MLLHTLVAAAAATAVSAVAIERASITVCSTGRRTS